MDLGFIKRWILFGAPPWQERRRQHPQARSTQDERRMHAGRRYRTAQWGWQPQDRWRYLVHFLVWLRDPECARQWNITGWIRDLWCQGNGQSGVFVAQIQKKKTLRTSLASCAAARYRQREPPLLQPQQQSTRRLARAREPVYRSLTRLQTTCDRRVLRAHAAE